MTTPTTLAETIARIELFLAENPLFGTSANGWLKRDLTALLACARRCEAIEQVGEAFDHSMSVNKGRG